MNLMPAVESDTLGFVVILRSKSGRPWKFVIWNNL
jgi:hypothetical protein